MKGYGVAGLALALVLGGGVLGDEKEGDKAKAVKEDWKRLKGTWEAVSAVVDGKKMPAPEEKVTVTVKDGKYTVKQGDKVVTQGMAKIDPTTTPKSIDGTPATGEDKGKTFRGIYEVKGDSQRVCFAPPGKPRPKAFESKEGSGHRLYTYKRVKARD
jgi:uncharacterized protein (TIGR03067 family)